jgi:hypothetical protein
MYFSHTVSCMTSADDILRYVGVFNVKVPNTWGGGSHMMLGPPEAVVLGFGLHFNST